MSPYRTRRRRHGRAHWLGPFPAYTRRTPRSRMTVTGCCLPIPLGIVALPAAAAYGMRARRRR